jgi:AmmeMemoRadiSam system protein B
MLILGVISPHPPIIIPAIGQERPDFDLVKPTIQALENIAQTIVHESPEKIIIISPHKEHGFDVPLYYLTKNITKDIRIEKILADNPSYEYYYELGKKYAEIDKNPERTIVIASGDLSHVLKNDGPYGFNEKGPILDKLIVEAVKNKKPQSLLNIEPKILEAGAECGLRSILFLFGIFNQINYKSEVLCYQGPYGVGYLTATFKPI